eukprot:CAMPEP_0118638256 /NCGR_PEP_ID=MMETSP0785-20121206/3580_1 /TAXON_ID=91992 /ORGANISM="Bolidomonas pacifica, Strain CCMP 1866" /LENGTH=1389 /DNA_ID=CAMNT_0006529479 /DNA_START=320 /DNA_END=4485 /DNA_ORIENTATION=-
MVLVNDDTSSRHSRIGDYSLAKTQTMLSSYGHHALLSKYFFLFRSYCMAEKLERTRRQMKKSSIRFNPSSTPSSSSTSPSKYHDTTYHKRNLQLADLHCEKMRKQRGFTAMLRLLKRFNKTPNNFKTNFVAPPTTYDAPPQNRPKNHALLSYAAFKWILSSLPPETYANQYVAPTHPTPLPSQNDAFIRCNALVAPSIFHSMVLRTPGGYALLLHAQASCDVYVARKVLKFWARYTKNIIIARCYYSTNLLVSTFTCLSVNAIACKSSRMRNQALTKVLILRSFHNLKRQFLLHRFYILKACVNALKNNADFSIAFNNMLLSKATRFFFLFYARKSFLSWATNAKSSRELRETLLRQHVLQKFFFPWGLHAVACAHHSRVMKRKILNSWVAVTMFSRRLAYLTARNTKRRQLELKHHILSLLYRLTSIKRMVVDFRYEALFRLVVRVFTSWKRIVKEFRHFHELMDYAARQHVKIQKRIFLERLVDLTNRRKVGRFQYYTAMIHFARHSFATWRAGAATQRRHRELLSSHLLNFTVKKRILPAWKKYTKTSLQVAKMSLSFTLKFYMTRWTSFIDNILKERAETQAALFFERAQRKSRTFSALANYTSRSVDLRKKSNLLAKSTRERLCRKALVQWDNKTISRHNARINFKVLKKRSEEALVRNYANKWKLETVHKRSKRMAALLKVWKAFVQGVALSKRSSENMELAERFRYIAMAKLGVNNLFNNWKNRSYLKACQSAAETMHLQRCCKSTLKGLQTNARKRKEKRDELRLIMTRLKFIKFRRKLKSHSRAKSLALLSATIRSWRNLTRQCILKREGKLAVLRSNFGVHAMGACFGIWKSLLEEKRRRMKHYFVAWIKFALAQTSKREALEVRRTELDCIRSRICFKRWRTMFVLERFAKRGLSAPSGRTLLARILAIWRQEARDSVNLRRAGSFLTRHLGELSRKVFLAWKQHAKFVKIETRRLRALRIARTKAASLAHQKEKRLIFTAFSAWEQRVIGWMKKESVMRDCDDYFELSSMKRVVRRLKVLLGKRRKRKLASSFLEEQTNLKMEELLFEWKNVVLSSKEKVDAHQVRNIFRKFRLNVKGQILLNQGVSKMLLRHNSALLKSHFLAWALLVASKKAKLGAMFKLIKKGWAEVGMKRFKSGPNIVGGVAILKVGKKCEVKLSLRLGFAAMKVNSRNVKCFDLLAGSTERQYLRIALSSWEDLTDLQLVSFEKCRIGLNQWRRFVEMKEKEHARYALKRLQRSALYKWNKNVDMLLADKVWVLDVAEKVDNYLQVKENERVRGAFHRLLYFVSRRVKSRHLVEVANEHHAMRKMEVGFGVLRDSAASRRRQREGKLLAVAHYRDGLVRRCFASIKLESVSIAPPPAEAAEAKGDEVRGEGG